MPNSTPMVRMNPMLSRQSGAVRPERLVDAVPDTAKSLPRCSAYMSVTVENFGAALATFASTIRGEPRRRSRMRIPGPTECSSAVSPMWSATSGSSSTIAAASSRRDLLLVRCSSAARSPAARSDGRRRPARAAGRRRRRPRDDARSGRSGRSWSLRSHAPRPVAPCPEISARIGRPVAGADIVLVYGPFSGVGRVDQAVAVADAALGDPEDSESTTIPITRITIIVAYTPG